MRRPPAGEPVRHHELTADPHGGLFAGIFGLSGGGLLRIEEDGSARSAATGLLLPNGQAIGLDGHTLIVAESAGQRLTAFTIGPQGALTERRVWASFGEPARARTLPEVLAQVQTWPDGIALDADGAIWVADPRRREVMRVLEGGEVTDSVSTGTLSCFACALGGKDGRDLFICAAPSMIDEATRRQKRQGRVLTTRVGCKAADKVSLDNR